MNGTRNLTQQNVQNPSHFVNGEMVETRTTTEAKRSISPIQLNFTTPKLKNPLLQQTIIQSTVKPSVAQKYSHIDYQRFLPVTKRSNKQQTSHRNNFAEHNYNYVNGPKKTKSETNTQIFAQSHKILQPTSNTVIFHDQPRSSQDKILINQIFLNHTHEMNKNDDLEITQHHTTIIFNNNIQSTHNHSNQLRCKTKSHYHNIYNNTK